MTVLVTGAAGRVGSRLVPRLLPQCGEVRILVRDPDRVGSLLALGAEPVVGDITDTGVAERAVKGVDSVVHLATVFRPGPEIEAVNVTATAALARAALAAGAERFVYLSTNQVYGPGRGRPALETDEPEPDRPYSQTKTVAERSLLGLFRDDGLPVRILRPPVIYGDGDPKLTEMLRFLGGPFHQRTQLVHHADVAQAVLLALRAAGVDGEIFNVGDDAPVTRYELMTLAGTAPASEDASVEPLDDPWQSIIDSSKIRRTLGFRPIYPSLQSAADALALQLSLFGGRALGGRYGDHRNWPVIDAWADRIAQQLPPSQ